MNERKGKNKITKKVRNEKAYDKKILPYTIQKQIK